MLRLAEHNPFVVAALLLDVKTLDEVHLALIGKIGENI
jgi:hypothetical protein